MKKMRRTYFCPPARCHYYCTVLPDVFSKNSENKQTSHMVAFLTKKLMVNTDFFWWHFLQKFSSNGVIADSLLSFHDFALSRYSLKYIVPCFNMCCQKALEFGFSWKNQGIKRLVPELTGQFVDIERLRRYAKNLCVKYWQKMTENDDFKTLKTVTVHLDFVQFKIRFQKASKSKRMVETRTPETKLTEKSYWWFLYR